MNYNELSKQVHEAAKANGWYDTEQSINTYLALIKSEIYEVFDAYRNNNYCNCMPNALGIINAELHCLDDKDLMNSGRKDFKEYIKDTFEDEIADTAIRILDFCGWYGIDKIRVDNVKTFPKGEFNSDLFRMDLILSKMYFKSNRKSTMKYNFETLLGMIESIAQVYEFNLEQHINLKLAYNATRGYKHGNKVM